MNFVLIKKLHILGGNPNYSTTLSPNSVEAGTFERGADARSPALCLYVIRETQEEGEGGGGEGEEKGVSAVCKVCGQNLSIILFRTIIVNHYYFQNRLFRDEASM